MKVRLRLLKLSLRIVDAGRHAIMYFISVLPDLTVCAKRKLDWTDTV